MKRRVLPFLKLGGRTVRFNVEDCDIAISTYEFKSISIATSAPNWSVAAP
jgi:hypothetical protein